MKGLLARMAIAGLGTLLVGGFTFAAVGNDHTGYDSTNNASVSQSNKASIDVMNHLMLNNKVDGTLSTGKNKSSYNTGNGAVHSGDAMATVTATNKGNDNTVALTASSMDTSDFDVANSTTGAESTNNAWVKNHNSLDIDVHNDAHVCNDIDVLAKTGGNASSYNTGSGSVTSGDASLTVSLNNTLNSSNTTVH